MTSLSSDGELSGYPTQSGTFSFVAAVTDSAQPAPDVVDVPFTFVLAPAGPLTVALGSLSATQGSPYIEDLYATGGFGPYAWSLDSGSLPPGLNLDSGGYIEGTPTTTDTFRSTVEVTGADGNGVLAGLTFTVTPESAESRFGHTPVGDRGRRLLRVCGRGQLRWGLAVHLVGVRFAPARADAER